MRKELKAGIEIETIFNGGLISYSSLRNIHKGLKNWSAKGDGSLRTYGKFENEEPIELITKAIIGRGRFEKALKEFKDFIITKSGTTDLNKVFDFNKSCGTHIHMGITTNKRISDCLVLEAIKEFRKDFFKKLKNLDIKEETKEAIKNQYFRSYSKRTTKRNYFHQRTRYLEINRLSERIGKGLEWRSFNICNVDNWEDFFKVIMLGYDCFSNLAKKVLYGYETKTRTTKLKVELPQEQTIQEINLNKNQTIQEINLNKNQTIEVNL